MRAKYERDQVRNERPMASSFELVSFSSGTFPLVGSKGLSCDVISSRSPNYSSVGDNFQSEFVWPSHSSCALSVHCASLMPLGPSEGG